MPWALLAGSDGEGLGQGDRPGAGADVAGHGEGEGVHVDGVAGKGRLQLLQPLLGLLPRSGEGGGDVKILRPAAA